MRRLVFFATLFTQFASAASAVAVEAVTAQGLGPVKFGMTVKQFGRALNQPVSEPRDELDRACFYLEANRFPGVAFMFEEGQLRRIDVRTSKIALGNGIRIGARASEAKRVYGAQLVDEPHHYSGPEDRYLTAALSSTVAARFETSGTKIDNYYVGFKAQVQYVEGCQ